MEDDYIYPPELLRTIDFEKEHLATYEPSISMLNPEPNLLVRPLQRSDYNKGKFKKIYYVHVSILKEIW